MQQLHLGATPWDRQKSVSDWVEQGVEAEKLGYDSFWFPESHFLTAGGNPQPLLIHAALAARTHTLRLGTTSYLLPIRTPLEVAEQVAVLDQLSGGRVILGVGRGFRRELFRAFSVSPKDKRSLFESALEAITSAWAGEALVRDGEPGSGRPVTLEPRPVQKPHPPIWVAAFGPKALAQAGRLALPYLASPMEPLARLRENLDLVAAAAHAAGHQPATEVPVMRSVFVSDDDGSCRRVREMLARDAEKRLGSRAASIRESAASNVDDRAWIGPPERIRECVGLYRERLGLTTLIVTGNLRGVDSSQQRASMERLPELLR